MATRIIASIRPAAAEVPGGDRTVGVCPPDFSQTAKGPGRDPRANNHPRDRLSVDRKARPHPEVAKDRPRCGISAWNVKLNERTKQQDLIITQEGEPEVTVDDLEVAQFVHL